MIYYFYIIHSLVGWPKKSKILKSNSLTSFYENMDPTDEGNEMDLFGNAYLLSSSLLHYTNEISKNTKENFENQYFDILIC